MFEVFYINRPKNDHDPKISVFEEIEKEIKSLETKVGRHLKCVLFNIELRTEKGIVIKKYESGNYADLKIKFFKVFYYRNSVLKTETLENGGKKVPLISGIIKFRKCKYYLEREFVDFGQGNVTERWVRKILDKDQIIGEDNSNDEDDE